METNYKHGIYTKEEIQQITELLKAGHTARTISVITNRSKGAINTLAYKIRKGQMNVLSENSKPKKEEISATTQPVSQPKTMTPREMIKTLYDMGYRIEDNHLVCYVKQTVKLSDIIAND